MQPALRQRGASQLDSSTVYIRQHTWADLRRSMSYSNLIIWRTAVVSKLYILYDYLR